MITLSLLAESLVLLLSSLLEKVLSAWTQRLWQWKWKRASSTSYFRGLFSANEYGSSKGQSSAMKPVAWRWHKCKCYKACQMYEHLQFILILLFSIFSPIISFLPPFPLIWDLMWKMNWRWWCMISLEFCIKTKRKKTIDFSAFVYV